MILKTLNDLSRGDGTLQQFARFLGVGLINTLFGYGVFAALVLYGMAPGVALAAATVAGVLFNFNTTGFFVFRRLPYTRLGHFCAGYAFVYGLNLAALESLLMLDLDPILAQGLLLPAMASAYFWIGKHLVFRPGP